MPESLVLAPTADPRVFVAPDGRRLTPPADWACLPPGDAGLTRRVKAAGPSWAVLERRGRKQFSRGLWAPRAHIDAARVAIEAERATVPLPTGVAWAATRAATASPRAAHRGANRRNARTSCSKLTTYAACARSRRSRSLARRRA